MLLLLLLLGLPAGITGDKTESYTGAIQNTDYWIVKLDNVGNIEWQNTIGGTGGDYLYEAKQTFDGGYILGGYSDSGSLIHLMVEAQAPK